MQSSLSAQRAFTGQAMASRMQTVRPVSSTALVVENRVALRFQRFGRKKLPFYRLVAIDSKERREGRPLEYLGWYDPLKKETNLNAPAIKQWLKVGALPSETVNNLLMRAYVVEPVPRKLDSPLKQKQEKKKK